MYPQSMFLSRNKKHNVYPCKPQFYYIKWGLRGSKLYRHVFVMPNYSSSDIQIFFVFVHENNVVEFIRSLLSTHSIGFHGEVRRISTLFG